MPGWKEIVSSAETEQFEVHKADDLTQKSYTSC